MDEPDFSGLSDYELVLLRHATIEAGFEEDKKFVEAIDVELKRREKMREQKKEENE